MLRGYIYAKSSIEDSTALGGFGGSDNVAKSLKGNDFFNEKGFFLKIDTTRKVKLEEKYNGYNFYIVNKSDSTVKLVASDSRLFVIAEVLYKGKWKPIEYLPSSWCGNSYHDVYLKQNEYWEFKVPKYDGKIKTKLRYSLMVGIEKFIYSNEIEVKINKKQLSEKMEYNSKGLMDPYND